MSMMKCPDCGKLIDTDYDAEHFPCIEKEVTEQCFCQSYYDDSNNLKDCTCGKCGYSVNHTHSRSWDAFCEFFKNPTKKLADILNGGD